MGLQIGVCRYAWSDLGVMFQFGFTKMCSAATFKTYFYHKDIWIAAI